MVSYLDSKIVNIMRITVFLYLAWAAFVIGRVSGQTDMVYNDDYDYYEPDGVNASAPLNCSQWDSCSSCLRNFPCEWKIQDDAGKCSSDNSGKISKNNKIGKLNANSVNCRRRVKICGL